MAPASNKRARAPVASSGAKKAKVVDPIAEKIQLISTILSDSQCQLQDSHREMLLLALPHVLKDVSDERHEYQIQVAQMVEKVLTDYLAHWQQQVTESKADISGLAGKASETMKAVEESAAKINEQEEEVMTCKGILQESSDSVKAAEEALQIACREVAEFDENLQLTVAERDRCSALYNDGFLALKTGCDDTKEVTRLLKEVQPQLKKLCTESSLLSALTPAFKKPVAERGPFDIMAIDGADKIFSEHVDKLRQQIDTADTTKAEKVQSETTAQGTLNAAVETRTASEDTLKAVETELASLESKHLDLLAACNDANEASEASESVVATKEGRLNEVQSALNTFTELLERKAVPEPAADANGMVEDKLEAIGESTPMELATVA